MDPFVGEIRFFPYNYTPQDWLDCFGQLVQINQYAALFSLVGTRFGGDGRSTFGIPNLQGLVVMGSGQAPGLTNRVFGTTTGAVDVTLSSTQVPTHSHDLVARAGIATAADLVRPPSATAALSRPTAIVAPTNQINFMFAPAATPASATLSAASISVSGGGTNGAATSHENRQPVLGLRFCICAVGMYPPVE
ncbi:MAG: tail fiber protein [Alphaproteobacteria bacterium]|nr:tail fiber protein [Alphaproteobacteria bacterium]